MANLHGRKEIPKRIRFEVFQRDGFKCRYCGKGSDDGAELQLDHVKSFADGGTDDPDNLVTSCADCNRGKGDKKAKPGNRRKTGKHPKHTSTSFKPGQSGNPSGRPKLSENQRAARLQAQAVIDSFTVDAAWTAVEMLTNFDPKARAAAFNSILDRSGLKGVDRLELTGKDGAPLAHDLSKLSDKEAKAFNEFLKKTARSK